MRDRRRLAIGGAALLALTAAVLVTLQRGTSDAGTEPPRSEETSAVGAPPSRGTDPRSGRRPEGEGATPSGAAGRREASSAAAEPPSPRATDEAVAGDQLAAVATSELRCTFVETPGGAPAVGVHVTLSPRDAEPVAGTSPVAGRSDALGRIALAGLHPGEYELCASSHWHRELTQAITIEAGSRALPPMLVERLPIAMVELLGGRPSELDEYQVSRLGHALEVPVAPDWTAALPWPDAAEPTVTVHGPGSLELVALFAVPDPTAEPMRVRVGGGEVLEVGIVGAYDGEQPLVLVLWFASELGYEAFVTQLVALGVRERLELCEPGTVWIDVGVQRADRTIQPLGRARASIAAGTPCAVTVDIGAERTYACFEARPGERVRAGTLFLAVEGDLETSPVGGALDGDGRLLVPMRSERQFFVVGTTGSSSGSDTAFAADVPAQIDTRAGGEVSVTLGAVLESSVELVDAVTGERLANWRFDVVGGTTRQLSGTAVTGSDGAPARVRWHERGAPCFELLWDALWSPLGPVPIQAGDVRIPITLRADCTFHSAGAPLADLRHEATGLDLSGLLAHGGVEVEERPDGRHLTGIPAGRYSFRLAGEDGWRGPCLVTAGAPCRVDVSPD